MNATTNRSVVRLSDEVAEAVGSGVPVLALETSGMVGGMAYPANLEVATAVDAAARAGGAVPARVAVMDGYVQVGLSPTQLDRLAAKDDAVKAGTRDVGRLLASGGVGALTVAPSIQAAHAAGITTFAVAGLGGVHRGASTSFDISADLSQLARTPVVVVCAGVKSILDAALTLEWLETAAVPVIGYRSDDFPGYLAVSSGRPIPARLDDVAQVAATALAHWQFGSSTALVLTAPIRDADGVDRDVLEAQIVAAMDAVAREGITGPDVTPHMLRHLAAHSHGATSEANRSVLLSVTDLGARVATAVQHARDDQALMA